MRKWTEFPDEDGLYWFEGQFDNGHLAQRRWKKEYNWHHVVKWIDNRGFYHVELHDLGGGVSPKGYAHNFISGTDGATGSEFFRGTWYGPIDPESVKRMVEGV